MQKKAHSMMEKHKRGTTKGVDQRGKGELPKQGQYEKK